MTHLVDELIELPYDVIDFLPMQIPVHGNMQFFEQVEQLYFTHENRTKFAKTICEIIIKSLCYFDFEIIFNGKTESYDLENITTLITKVICEQKYTLNIVLPFEKSLICIVGGQLSISIYNPNEYVRSVMKPLVLAEKLFWWTPEEYNNPQNIKPNELDIFEIASLKKLKEVYFLNNYDFVDFCLGHDENIYLLYSNKPYIENRGDVSEGYTANYTVLEIMYDWENKKFLGKKDYELIDFKGNFRYIRLIGDDFLLVDKNCNTINGKLENNALVVNKLGQIKDEFCLGDGISSCIVTEDKRINVGYLDAGIFKTTSSEPFGKAGVLSCNEFGDIIWQNTKHKIMDCYAMTVDDDDDLYYYFFRDFNIVRTDFEQTHTFWTNISGCTNFAISKNRDKFIFKDDDFFVFDVRKRKIVNKTRLEIMLDNQPAKILDCNFLRSKLLFIASGGILCGCDF